MTMIRTAPPLGVAIAVAGHGVCRSKVCLCMATGAAHHLQPADQDSPGNCGRSAWLVAQGQLLLPLQARSDVERELRQEREACQAAQRRSADLEHDVDQLSAQLAQKEVC